MRLLTADARLMCLHRGVVNVRSSQDLATIDGRPVLVETDPEGASVSGCPNAGPTIKPCGTTLQVREGYSALVRIDGRRACLETVVGRTDGTPPGAVDYQVVAPGQDRVEADR